MTSPLEKIIESKRALRRGLTSRPVGERLKMLDAMLEGEIAIRRDRIDSRRSGGNVPHA